MSISDVLRQCAPPGSAGLQPGLEATLERGAPRKNSGELAVDLYNRHLVFLLRKVPPGQARIAHCWRIVQTWSHAVALGPTEIHDEMATDVGRPAPGGRPQGMYGRT